MHVEVQFNVKHVFYFVTLKFAGLPVSRRYALHVALSLGGSRTIKNSFSHVDTCLNTC